MGSSIRVSARQCDGSATGCQVGETCNDACQCQPTRADKSSPIEITADGRKVVAVNTDTDTVVVLPDRRRQARSPSSRRWPSGRSRARSRPLVSKPWAYVANTVSGTVSVIDTDELLDRRDDRRRHRALGRRRLPERPVRLRRQRQQQHGAGDRHEQQHRHRDHPGRPQPARARHHQRRRRRRPRRDAVRAELLRPSARRASSRRAAPTWAARDDAAPSRPEPRASRSSARASSTIRARRVVDVMSTATNAVVGQVILAPMADTGFNFARGAVRQHDAGRRPAHDLRRRRHRRHPGAADGRLPEPAAEHRDLRRPRLRARTPPRRPSRRCASTSTCRAWSRCSTSTPNSELADQTFNMNRGHQLRPAGGSARRAGPRQHRSHVPVGAGRHRLLDGDRRVLGGEPGQRLHRPHGLRRRGKPTINAPTAAGPFAASPVTRIFTIDPANATSSGRNPRGIVLDADGTHGYVVCPTTRDVVVADLVGNTVLQRVRSSELPTDPAQLEHPARQDRLLHLASVLVRPRLGRLLVVPPRRPHRHRDVVVRGRPAPDDRRSTAPSATPRASPISACSTGRPVRDENPDFELNTRGVFGGRGFITVNTDVNRDGITPDSDPNVRNYGPASSHRALQQDDITNWIAFDDPQPHRAAQHQRQSDPRPRHLRRGGSRRRQLRRLPQRRQVDHQPRHLRPGRRQSGAGYGHRDRQHRRSPRRLPERLQLGCRRRPRL